MKLLFVADIHYALKQYDWLCARAPEFDAVAIGGDLLDLGSSLDLETQIVVVEKYLNRIARHTEVIVCSGNHDGDARNHADESVCQWLEDVRSERLHVDGDPVPLGGALVTVCPWWDGPVSREEVGRLIERDAQREARPWIWVYHAPPEGTKVCWTGRDHAGDAELVKWITRYQPDLVLSGHIHNAPFYQDGSWIDRIGKTWVVNVGRQIGAQPAFLILDLETMNASWVTLEEKASQDLTEQVRR